MSVIADAKKKLARRYLDELLAKKDKEIYRDLVIAATMIAKRMMMDWLDSKGVHHCAECPSTDQLLSISGNYYCHEHGHNITVEHQKPLELIRP